MTPVTRGRGGARAVLVLLNILVCSLCGCIEDFPAYVGVQQGADGGQGGAGGGSDGSPADSTRPRDGGTDSVATDMATPDARLGDGGRNDAVADGGEADSGYPEFCNGLDDDNDGRIDEGLPLNCCGQCGDPRDTCNRPDQQRMCAVDAGEQGDAGPADAEVLPPADLGMEDQGEQQCIPEVCDDIDNDCDGTVDEDAPRNNCGGCGPDNVEICDGLDNDCDGTVDNVAGFSCNCLPGQERECYSGPNSTLGEGACAAGSQTCNAQGNWAACEGEILPQADICDGMNNDCDGRTDEFAGVRGCTVGVGACSREGQRVCVPARGEIVCQGDPGPPADEVCDNRDNDCNGSTDEDFDGLGDACQAGEGACQRQGQIVCDGLARTRCNADPGAPRAEVCDNQDNDCNGTVDDVAGLGNQCTNGRGICARQGRLVCMDGEANPVCDAQPGPAAGPEVACNVTDEDCNGRTDEGFPLGQACFAGEQGICRTEGTWGCDGGAVICTAIALQPQVEACDGNDNDCDGMVDEGLDGTPCATDQLGVCAQGVVSCVGGQERCNAPLPADEDECGNGRDDDCDGSVDNGPFCNCAPGEGRSCYEGPEGSDGFGTCQSGVALCDGLGGLGPCEGQVLPAAEICDGNDNDCDGNLDEGFGLGEACSVGQGACERSGVRVCQDLNATRCNAEPGLPVAERCDGNDNDCDGTTDEGLLNACGVCGPVPSEICNDRDDDCDGVVDEELSCPEWTQTLGGARFTRHLVSMAEYASCHAQGQAGCPLRLYQGPNCNEGVPGRENHPANCISFEMMEDFCTWVGAEVPTQAEYLLFGGYEQGVNEGYPWGGEPIECNRAHTAGCGLGTRPVDARPTGASPYDVYDPIGNVRKWTTTPARNGRVIVGCGWADQALDPDGIPVCTLVWTEVFLNQNTHSPDLGGYCIRRN